MDAAYGDADLDYSITAENVSCVTYSGEADGETYSFSMCGSTEWCLYDETDASVTAECDGMMDSASKVVLGMSAAVMALMVTM